MKNRIVIVITAILLALGLSVGLVACNGGEKAEYGVTVYSPNNDPLSGITVSWNTKKSTAGSAVTNENGKATVELPLGTYTVELTGYGDELDYASVSVGSAMRSIGLTLSVKRLNYTVTVTDKAGAPAQNVTVTWTNGTTIAGSVKTNASGKAECELDYGDYSVTLSALPDGNVYGGAKAVSGKAPAAEFALIDGAPISYGVTVRSEGRLLFKTQPVQVYDSTDTLIASGSTDESGVFTFSAAPGSYTATATDIPAGYTVSPASLTFDSFNADIVLHSEVITSEPDANTTYVMGDIIHNYKFKTPYLIDGKAWEKSIEEILRTKQMIILNNWGTNCSWCVKEMPAMQSVYERYSDSIEIIAVSNYAPLDTDAKIINHQASNGYTFPMMRDLNDFKTKFSVTNWPTTVVIDRFGAIARIEIGAVTSEEAWERMILKFVGDEYIQTFTPGDRESESINTEVARPDVELAADHYEKLAAAVKGANAYPQNASVLWYGETEYDMAWPFVYGKVDGISDTDVMYASNSGKANSMAIIYADINVPAGNVLTFDYYADTESDDILYMLWDGKIIRDFAGSSNGWKTCYLYSDITNGRHTLSVTYIKDSSGNGGTDNVYIKNLRFVDITTVTEPTDMLRGAAYGTPVAGATTFPYYAGVALADDGYYHVDLSSLQNHELAGNDQSPLLLVNLLNATSWNNNYSISELVMGTDEETGEHVVSCEFTINGVKRDYRADLIKYLTAALSSDVPDCVPVDGFLHDMLVAFMKNASGSASHDKEWLEACYFYSHYGSGEPVGNPVMGLMERTAIEITAGTHTAELTRNTQPFPAMIYSFTPETSAVYKIESLIPSDDNIHAAQVWLYDDDTDIDHPYVYCGDEHITLGGVNEHNFEVYRYMQQGHKYYVTVAFRMTANGSFEHGSLDFKISDVGQSVTVLEACSHDTYEMVLDGDGNITDKIILSGAIKYKVDGGGYYHSVNPDGTLGDFIYLDVLNADTSALGTIPLIRLVDKFVQDPYDYSNLDYKFFDFRYCVMFLNAVDEDGNEVVNYATKYETKSYKDYTATLKAYINSAPTSGDKKGLVKVDETIVEMLTLFTKLRLNAAYDGVYETVQDNEWLRFCWYYRTYNAQNP